MVVENIRNVEAVVEVNHYKYGGGENIRYVVVSGGDETVEIWWWLAAFHDKSASHVFWIC